MTWAPYLKTSSLGCVRNTPNSTTGPALSSASQTDRIFAFRHCQSTSIFILFQELSLITAEEDSDKSYLFHWHQVFQSIWKPTVPFKPLWGLPEGTVCGGNRLLWQEQRYSKVALKSEKCALSGIVTSLCSHFSFYCFERDNRVWLFCCLWDQRGSLKSQWRAAGWKTPFYLLDCPWV